MKNYLQHKCASEFFILHFPKVLHFLGFFLSEVFQELGTFECIDTLNVFNIQLSFELSDIIETFAFHPCGEETGGFSDKCIRILLDSTANFYG